MDRDGYIVDSVKVGTQDVARADIAVQFQQFRKEAAAENDRISGAVAVIRADGCVRVGVECFRQFVNEPGRDQRLIAEDDGGGINAVRQGVQSRLQGRRLTGGEIGVVDDLETACIDGTQDLVGIPTEDKDSRLECGLSDHLQRELK